MNATITKIPDDPTRYRWVIVAVASVFMSMGVGSLWSISIFLKPIIAEFGWMRGETSLAFTAGTVSMGVGGILMGYLTDRYPIRWIVLAGALGLSASYLLLSRLTTPWEFYLYYCLLGGVGSAALWTPMLAIVGNWFEEKKGLAMGLAMSGVALGNGFIIKISGFLITDFGWRYAYQTLGLICLLGLLPLVLLVKDAPRAQPAPPAGGLSPATGTGADAMAPGALVGWLGMAAFFCCISFSTNLVHLGALVQDMGFDANNAATVLLLLFIFSIAGRIYFGRLSDSAGGVHAFLVAAAGQTALIFWFPWMASYTGLIFLTVAFGLFYSGTMTALMIAVGQRIPLHRRGISLGIVNLFGWLGNGLGGYQGGGFYDLTGGYALPYGVAALSGLVAVAILIALLVKLRGERLPIASLATA